MTAAPLDILLDLVTADVDDLMTRLEVADITARAWRDRMAATLARGHLAAYMAGAGSAELDDAGQQRLLRDVASQMEFLDKFAVEVQDAATFQRGWNARAAMYAEAVGASYYRGQFRMWPLPSVPRDGSTGTSPTPAHSRQDAAAIARASCGAGCRRCR